MNDFFYALTKDPTPLFNTFDIASQFGGTDGDTLKLDEKGLMRCVETVLLPGSKLTILKRVAPTVLQVRTNEYPYPGKFYVDERFITRHQNPSDRIKVLPSLSSLIASLRNMEHFPYVWGGNWPNGIDVMLEFYPARSSFSRLKKQTQNIWRFRGCDCTGLPYYLTDGYTPRNSSSLVSFGNPVNIEGKELKSIIECLESGDFIVWDGHLVWVIDQNECIESLHPNGLMKSNLSLRLAEIMKERKPVNDWNSIEEMRFVVRRWHPERQS